MRIFFKRGKITREKKAYPYYGMGLWEGRGQNIFPLSLALSRGVPMSFVPSDWVTNSLWQFSQQNTRKCPKIDEYCSIVRRRGKNWCHFPAIKCISEVNWNHFQGVRCRVDWLHKYIFLNLENISKNNIFDRQPGVKAKINVLWSCYLVTPRRQVTNNEMLL